MNKKSKLFTLLATVATVAEPVSNVDKNPQIDDHDKLAQEQIINKETDKITRSSRFMESSMLDKFINFLENDFYFTDLTYTYATPEQKIAIEYVAQWIGKPGDYRFIPMTMQELKNAATNYFTQTINNDQLEKIIKDFTDVQAENISIQLTAAYHKWIQTMEKLTDEHPIGHQLGWYNENNLSYMLPAYVMDQNGLTYDETDIDIKNPKVGLQNMINDFHNKLLAGKPTYFASPYNNISAGSDIEKTFNEYKNWGKNQLSYYASKILSEINQFYYGFMDTNQSNNSNWLYYLNSDTLDPLTNVEDLISRWTFVLSKPEWRNTSILNFLTSTKVWNNLTAEKISGKDANIEQFPFEYTSEFQAFRDINLNSFSSAIDDLYDTFLSTQYYGYIDSSSILNVIRYYETSTQPMKIYSKQAVIASFEHNSKTYSALSEFYSWKAGNLKYDWTRTEQFNQLQKYELDSLLLDFQSILNLVESSYYGYGSLTKNYVDIYLFPTLKVDGPLSSAKDLTDFYIKNKPEITEGLFTGYFNTKYLFDTLKNDEQEGGIKSWINDQKIQISSALNAIFANQDSWYLGYIAKLGDQNYTKVDRLLTHFPQATALTSDAIIASFTLNNLPSGLLGLYELHALVQSIQSDDTSRFQQNQNDGFNSQIDYLISRYLAWYYLGYQVNLSSTNKLSLLFQGNWVSGDSFYDRSGFSTEIFLSNVKAGNQQFPKPYEIQKFLVETEYSPYFEELWNQQLGGFISDVNTIIEKIKNDYYGYGVDNNSVTKYIIEYSNGSEGLVATTIVDNFRKSNPTKVENGKVNGLFRIQSTYNKLINDSSAINEFNKAQNDRIIEKWNKILPSIIKSYRGYSLEATTLLGKTIFYGIVESEDIDNLEPSKLWESFKDNIVKFNGTQDFPLLFNAANFVNSLLDSENDLIKDFTNEQTNFVKQDIEKIILALKTSYFGYNNLTSIPNVLKQSFFDQNGKILTSDTVLAKIYNHISLNDDVWKTNNTKWVLNIKITQEQLPELVNNEKEQLTKDMTAIMDLIWNNSRGKRYNYVDPNKSPFVGSELLWVFFIVNGDETYGVKLDVESSIELFLQQVKQISVASGGTYENVADFLSSLYTNNDGKIEANGILLNWKIWQQQ